MADSKRRDLSLSESYAIIEMMPLPVGSKILGAGRRHGNYAFHLEDVSMDVNGLDISSYFGRVFMKCMRLPGKIPPFF